MTVSIICLLALLVILGIAIIRQPDEFRIARSATFAAPANTVFDQVNNFQRWGAWSPWAAMDPQAQYEFDGPTGGVGAITRWKGNAKVGQGSMTILESEPNRFIKMQLVFLKPMQASNTAEFLFEPNGDQTRLTWTMTGKNTFFGKAINLLMDCDKMVGKQFETGLDNLRKVVEKTPR